MSLVREHSQKALLKFLGFWPPWKIISILLIIIHSILNLFKYKFGKNNNLKGPHHYMFSSQPPPQIRIITKRSQADEYFSSLSCWLRLHAPLWNETILMQHVPTTCDSMSLLLLVPATSSSTVWQRAKKKNQITPSVTNWKTLEKLLPRVRDMNNLQYIFCYFEKRMQVRVCVSRRTFWPYTYIYECVQQHLQRSLSSQVKWKRISMYRTSVYLLLVLMYTHANIQKIHRLYFTQSQFGGRNASMCARIEQNKESILKCRFKV